MATATKNSVVNSNPTAFFLSQSTETTKDYKDKINEYVKKLLNLNSCVLCRQDYNFSERIPRILIHCGHTICTACLKNFHKNRRVRCPLCLKLIKNIETLDRLPVNHTIFSKMMDERKEEFQRVSGRHGRMSDFTRASMPNRDKQQQYIEPLVEQYASKNKPKMEDLYQDQLFESTGQSQDIKQKIEEFKKQMKWDYQNPIDNKIMKIAEYQNFMEDKEADEEYYDPNLLKGNAPEFEYGNNLLKRSYVLIYFLNHVLR